MKTFVWLLPVSFWPGFVLGMWLTPLGWMGVGAWVAITMIPFFASIVYLERKDKKNKGIPI